MKQKCLIVMLMLSAFVFSTCAIRQSEPIRQEEFSPSDPDVIKGEQVYMKYCQKCHPGGEGGLGPSFNPLPVPGFIKQFQIRHGLGVMPSFKKGEISKEDLKNIRKYLHEWKHY
jgi:mono/diheme cytochrome c family protein